MSGAARAMTAPDSVRPPAVAGQFYTADPRALAREIQDFFGQCSPEVPAGVPVALISPHAGYRYSGLTAAEGYNAVRSGTFDTVVVVSPSHREYFDGISVYPGKSYATPLGGYPSTGNCAGRSPPETTSSRSRRPDTAANTRSRSSFRSLPPCSGTSPSCPVRHGRSAGRPLLPPGEETRRGARGPEGPDRGEHRSLALPPRRRRAAHRRPFHRAAGAVRSRGDHGGPRRREPRGVRRGPGRSGALGRCDRRRDRVAVRRHSNSGDTGGDASAVVGYVSAVVTAS